jgi:hypothetical protein
MCDYSMSALASRPAKVDDKLVVKQATTGSTGFLETAKNEAGFDYDVAVCVLPGTEIAFDKPIEIKAWLGDDMKTYATNLARFRQIDLEETRTHHDALELATGEIIKLNLLIAGQTATVLQLPAAPKTEAEAKEQERLPVTA